MAQFLIVTNNDALGHSLQEHFQRMGLSADLESLRSVGECVSFETDGVLLLAAGEPSEGGEIIQFVQEVRLKNWPMTLVAVEANGAARNASLALLDPYVKRRLRWPVDASALESVIKQNTGRGRHFTRLTSEPLDEQIRRQLVSHTPSLQMLVEPIHLAAQYDVPVLVSGETGTGKTHLARLIHQSSPRQDERFLVVSCGALAANLIESEFFGHAKGAFTGADRVKEGKFAAAGRGTLLLDEIDTLSLEQQANLLRVLETGEYEPVGSNETKICHARIIAASNWDLEEAVEQGKFRRDLYYRLHVMAFHLPALRERQEDIAPLARGMAAHFNDKFRKGLFEIKMEAIHALEGFAWPGNIRQLENVIQQAVLVCGGAELTRAHLPPSVQKNMAAPQANGYSLGSSLVQNREEVERVSIQRALEKAGNNRTEAAQSLGISRVTLYKKMKKYGLMNPKFQAVS